MKFNSGTKNANFFAEEDRMTSVGSNFLVEVYMELTPTPPSTCVHLSLSPPLRVNVINGWSLGVKIQMTCNFI